MNLYFLAHHTFYPLTHCYGHHLPGDFHHAHLALGTHIHFPYNLSEFQTFIFPFVSNVPFHGGTEKNITSSHTFWSSPNRAFIFVAGLL